jgi:uncharacterized repeat protein (TIGR03803 family)
MRKVSLTPQFASFTGLVVLLLFAGNVSAQVSEPNDTVLHVFSGGSDGYIPAGGVVFDQAGNLYGTTYSGGAADCLPASECGILYQLVPTEFGAWTENILHVFLGTPANDGATPGGGLLIDPTGNLYGVTAYGGDGGCVVLGIRGGCGTVFEMSPPLLPGGDWIETILYTFQGGNDGFLPAGDLTWDAEGNMYGATQYGGSAASCNAFYTGCGTVFELSPPKTQGAPWTEKVLYAFKGGVDGTNPNGGLVIDKHGAIYGTTYYGGPSNTGCNTNAGTGCGTAFELRPVATNTEGWSKTAIYEFKGYPTDDGAVLPAGLVADDAGRLYGVTEIGGTTGLGTVFQLTAPSFATDLWEEKVILNFDGAHDGGLPMAGLLMKDNQLYGTASQGGAFDVGTVFRLGLAQGPTPGLTRTVLATFPPGGQAEGPQTSVSFDNNGRLYGTTYGYDHNLGGAVFRIDYSSAK